MHGDNMMEKETRSVFVIMPFTRTPTRNKADLDAFFKVNLKERIENHQSFKHRYIVSRSGNELTINEAIIRDLFRADIVLCDLSGHTGNPNVMFELGIRFAVSNKPVILFREDAEENKTIFDISGYYTEPYSPHRYRELEQFIIDKISDYEKDELGFNSPILKILGGEPIIMSVIAQRTLLRRLQMLQFSIHSLRAKLSGDVCKFLLKHDIKGFPEPLDEFGAWLSQEREKLKTLDWETCKLGFNKSPVIEQFLSNPDIEAVFPSDLRDRFLVYFHTWYDLFLNDLDNFEVTMSSIETTLWELYILHQLLLAMMSYANGSEREKAVSYDHFNRTFERSVIAKYTLESVGILTFLPPRFSDKGRVNEAQQEDALDEE
jgi:hypothetical protein